MGQVIFEESGERRLICAVLLQAIKDSRKGYIRSRYEARCWMLSSEAKYLASLVGLAQVWPPDDPTFLEEA